MVKREWGLSKKWGAKLLGYEPFSFSGAEKLSRSLKFRRDMSQPLWFEGYCEIAPNGFIRLSGRKRGGKVVGACMLDFK